MFEESNVAPLLRPILRSDARILPAFAAVVGLSIDQGAHLLHAQVRVQMDICILPSSRKLFHVVLLFHAASVVLCYSLRAPFLGFPVWFFTLPSSQRLPSCALTRCCVCVCVCVCERACASTVCALCNVAACQLADGVPSNHAFKC